MSNLLELYGTDEPLRVRRQLTAGPLTAILEAGQLRDIRWHGVEVLRGIAWLVRDAGWRTLVPVLGEPLITQTPTGFEVRYRGHCADDVGRFTLEATIAGRTEGELSFSALARIESDLTTNRTGFVVLHPDTAAGLPLKILHPDGSIALTTFPTRIMPDQPAFEIAALTHQDRGITARVSFDGGIFEMEDQRNWLDASFKTYVRPLRLPKPYLLTAGSVDRQSVILRLNGRPAAADTKATPACRSGIATMPQLWLRTWPGADLPDMVPPDLANGLIVRADLSNPASSEVATAAALAKRNGWPFGVEVLLPLRDPGAEAASIMRMISDFSVERLLVAGLRDQKSRPSNTLPDGEWPLEVLVSALRHLEFGGLIGAGTPAFFTEFNRNPPPTSDFAWFSGSAVVHAADDTSVFETAGVLPAALESAMALVPGTPMFPGPLAIAPAVSPYAPSLADNADGKRICMAAKDPRHRAAFGAAHLAAVFARLVGRVEAAAPLWLNGPSGCIASDGRLWPVGKLHATLASLAGAVHLGTEWHGPAVRVFWKHPQSGEGYLLCNTAPATTPTPNSWQAPSLAPLEVNFGAN
jgi:hypothetical protein